MAITYLVRSFFWDVFVVAVVVVAAGLVGVAFVNVDVTVVVLNMQMLISRLHENLKIKQELVKKNMN